MTRLPATLASWQESLAALQPRVAVALGPMLNVLDDLVGRLDEQGGESGDPDGYDGTTNRGDIGRLLLHEWLLAQEVPGEFLRRAAENELSYLRRAHRRLARQGRMVVIADCGPEQLGVGRLVQLAALVVLHRRARAAGSELILRILQHQGGVRGDLAELLTDWLAARTPQTPTRAQVEAAFAETEIVDRVWLLAGPTARQLAAPHRRTVSSWVSSWSATGASEVTIRVGDATARVHVPDPRTAVAALRGEGLLARRSNPSMVAVPTTGHGAVFNSADSRLLWRGASADEIYGCFVSTGDTVKVRCYRLGGAVLAAASLGKRVVAAVTDGTGLWIQVIGKRLARTDRLHIPLRALELDQAALASILESPVAPLYLQGGRIVLNASGGWWSLGDDGVWREHALAMAPGTALDTPRAAYANQNAVWVGQHRWTVGRLAAGPLLGPPDNGSWCAWSEDTRVWRISRGRDVVEEIGVGENDHVIGLCVIDQQPSLMIVSPGGLILRQLTARHVKTWTRWAGPAHFDLHPVRPWLARTVDDRITVGDVATGKTLLEVRTAG